MDTARALPLILSLVALPLAGLALVRSRVSSEAPPTVTPSVDLTSVEERLATLERRLAVVERPARERPVAADTELTQRVEALAARVEALESEGTRPRAAVAADEEPGDPAEFERLRELVFSGGADAATQARFWELARTSDALPRLVEELEQEVAASPEDVAVRMHLASACVAKLYTVPDGPERGAWAARAQAQWTEVLEREPTHWQARYSLATALSNWPPQFGFGPKAIEHFETLREQQESGAVRSGQSSVYLELATLYRRQGNAEQALRVLESGADRHPEDERLRDALDAAR